MTPRTRRFATFALLTSLSFAACSKRDAAKEAATPSFATEAAAQGAGSSSTPTSKLDEGKAGADKINAPAVDPHRKVIRTGRIELVVKTYDDARAKLDALLAAAGGYVDSTQVHHYQGAVSNATLVLRIPQDAFGQFVPKLKELGEIASESTDAADVTDQFVDVSARLASAKTLEKRLLELAADRSSGVEALLAVERELARVRGEIESYEGRLRQWNDQISMSTLTLTMSTVAPAIAAPKDPSLGQRIKGGFSDSISALESFASWLVVTGTALLPWMILMVPGFFLGRRLYRRYGKRLPKAVARKSE